MTVIDTLPEPVVSHGGDLAPTPPPAGRWQRLVRGRPEDPAWVRPSIAALLIGTAVLYLWGLGASGWANSFYSAAVQAGSTSWKAMFFGSFDGANFITVDKAPAALWVMDISARIFGVNAWSILVPQALEGVAAVGVLYLTVRRWSSPAAGLVAGAVMALTPVAALMFRFNNPDAFLVLLLVGGAYATTRAIENGSTRWLVFAFALIGFGFLAKMLQAFVVAPAFAIAYLVAAPPAFWKRVRQMFVAGIAMFLAAGWWVAIVELWPAASRPYIGGSQNNSMLNLIFGYNGFGRLTGNETGSVGGGANAGGMWGPTGITRMFNADFGGQTSWLIPAALVFLVAGLVVTAKRSRSDRTRAALLIWGGWLVITAITFSFGAGIIHPYYTVALAPGIGGLVGVGAQLFWTHRHEIWARIVLAGALVVTVWWSSTLLERTSNWHPEIRQAVILIGIAAAIAIAIWPRISGRLGVGLAIVAIAIGLLGPAAYSVETAATAQSGAIPSAGPSGQSRGFGGNFRGRVGANGGQNPFANGQNPFANGQNPPANGQNPFANGQNPFAGGGAGARGGFGGGNGGIGGLLNGSSSNAAVTKALRAKAGKYTWVAATVGSNNAAGYQLASGDPVMAIGGFNGTDPAPSLKQFEQWVGEGKIHYFIGGGRGGGFGQANGGSSVSTRISSWVTSHFPASTIGGTTVYDLSGGASHSSTSSGSVS